MNQKISLKIKKIFGRQIIDSRGNPTCEADIVLDDGTIGRGAVPSGASTGKLEALELRDNDPSTYLGKSVNNAINNMNQIYGKIDSGKFFIYIVSNIDEYNKYARGSVPNWSIGITKSNPDRIVIKGPSISKNSLNNVYKIIPGR
mgnify:CR=1 FL=1